MPEQPRWTKAELRRAARFYLRAGRASLTLLTRFRVGGFPYTEEELRWSTAFLPMVGTALGILLVMAWSMVDRAGPWVAATVTVGVSLALTGALHEDGLADTADALGGGTTPEEVHAILKDSRIGTFGAAALTLALLLRVALLVRLEAHFAPLLLLAHTLSRAVAVGLICTLPHARSPKLSKTATMQSAGNEQLLVALLYTLALSALLVLVGGVSGPAVLVALGGATLTGTLLALYFRRRVKGITGDFLGATQQASEIVVLLLVAIALGGA